MGHSELHSHSAAMENVLNRCLNWSNVLCNFLGNICTFFKELLEAHKPPEVKMPPSMQMLCKFNFLQQMATQYKDLKTPGDCWRTWCSLCTPTHHYVFTPCMKISRITHYFFLNISVLAALQHLTCKPTCRQPAWRSHLHTASLLWDMNLEK